jgi:predicted tellurium resistance membrane protein TerC
MDWLLSTEIWASLVTLTVLEIVLGIDNIVILAIISNSLPPHLRERARLVGLSLALVMRIALLFAIAWIATLTTPLFAIAGQEFSGRDLVMLGGGLFLIYKAVHEMHEAVAAAGRQETAPKASSFLNAIAQIVVLDLVFSVDSVITAVGMARQFWVMVVAVVIAVGIMLAASGPIVRFIHANPTVKMLALAFVLLIGFTLVAEGFEVHIPKGYIYAAMAFSVMVEALNVTIDRRKRRAREAAEAPEARDAPEAPQAAAPAVGDAARDAPRGNGAD